MTVAELEVEHDRMCAALTRELERERNAHLAASHAFEQLVASTVALGAGDRDTAIRWIVDGIDGAADNIAHYGWSYLEWELGLPFGYIEGRRV